MYRLLIRTNDYFDWLLARGKGPDDSSPIDIFPTDHTSIQWSNAHPVHPGVRELEFVFMTLSQQVFDSASRRYLHIHVRTQETQLACVLERFRRAKGRFPDFLSALPNDAFDGKPLRYRRNPDGGYDRWSIGPDRKDDGGKLNPKEDSQSQPDWLWHMPGRAKAP
jgi:hypothetical protein